MGRPHKVGNLPTFGSLEALVQAEIGCSIAEAKAELVVEANPKRGPRDNCTDLDNLSKLTQQERAVQNGVGIVTQRKLDYLAGHADALLSEVQTNRQIVP